MRNKFFSLLRKEIKDLRFSTLILSIIILSFEAFLFTRRSFWPDEVIFGLSCIPLGFLPFIFLWKGFNSFRSEWKDDTIYSLLTLPVPGSFLTGSKIVAHLLEFIWLFLLSLTSIYFHFTPVMNEVYSTLPQGFFDQFYLPVFYCGLAYLLFNFLFYLSGQFSYLAGHLFNRFQGILTAVFFIWSQWFIYRIGGLSARLLRWLPELKIDIMYENQWGFNTATFSMEPAPIVASLIMGLLLFGAASWFVEEHLEV